MFISAGGRKEEKIVFAAVSLPACAIFETDAPGFVTQNAFDVIAVI